LAPKTPNTPVASTIAANRAGHPGIAQGDALAVIEGPVLRIQSRDKIATQVGREFGGTGLNRL
jgi:hypothetical protein